VPDNLKSGAAISSDYCAIFGKAYEEAYRFTYQQPEIDKLFRAAAFSPEFMYSLVFPELIRYNALRDGLELASLYTLYVQFGNRYSDFSIGPFQMKPSFVEQLEQDYMSMREKIAGNYLFDLSNTPTARRKRITRINDYEWQARYLVIFVIIMDDKFSSLPRATEEEKVRLYASAYNVGYRYSKSMIEYSAEQNYFHTSLTSNAMNKYNYAKIALDYYGRRKPGP